VKKRKIHSLGKSKLIMTLCLERGLKRFKEDNKKLNLTKILTYKLSKEFPLRVFMIHKRFNHRL